ncbi:MAG: helicase-related protein [Chloroflexi bacterium]|nr:helicase-related protein [Chloroflexota bacterium]
MTAGALAFWQRHTENRPTIAYAVSVDHAHNLAAVFNDAGIQAAVILGDTNREERDKAIAGFRDGSIRVLVNVIVATEGFDLPDASCVIIARPTMSLALYLQMVGRGLRPKPDGGDCILLDLAANAVTHGLPEDYREWSLEPRGAQKSGAEAPVVVCPECGVASPAASHNCRGCGYAFGKVCNRCGRWRSYRRRWLYETECGDAHQRVCDLCHIDAHIQAHLPVMPPLNQLVDQYDPEDEMTFPSNVEIDDGLANRLSALFRELLESERQSIAGADVERRNELRSLIDEWKSALNDEENVDALFDQYVSTLPQRPSRAEERRIFRDWEEYLWLQVDGWEDELAGLESNQVDERVIFNSAWNKVLHLLRREARNAELLPDDWITPQASGVFSPFDEDDDIEPFPNKRDTWNDTAQTGQIPSGTPKRFCIGPNRDGIFAKCDVYSRNQIIVLAGSTATKRELTQSYWRYQRRKDRLIADGVLVEERALYRFAEDYKFQSPHAVSTIVLGNTGYGKGLDLLKDAEGIPFRHYFP